MDSEVIAIRPVMNDEIAHERDDELIAQRAYEIHASGEGGTDFDDWLRAKRELNDERSFHEHDDEDD